MMEELNIEVGTGPSLERVPRVPGTRDILSSYGMATREFFINYLLRVAWHPWNFDTFNKWHPWIDNPNKGPE